MLRNAKRVRRGVWKGFLKTLLVALLLYGAFWVCEPYFLISKPDTAKWTKAQTEMGEIHNALSLYARDHGLKYPAKLDALTEDYFTGGVPKDPFTKDDYIYELTSTGFRLICLGKDQVEGGEEVPDRDIIYNEKGPR